MFVFFTGITNSDMQGIVGQNGKKYNVGVNLFFFFPCQIQIQGANME